MKRPNRFIAEVQIDGKIQICHVKNTGRCKELLLPGATVYVERAENPDRKTAWDLIAVYKGDMLVNIDSAVTNAVAEEYLQSSFPDALCIKREVFFGHSRFDFYIETADRRIFAEVKSVTLENEGIASFPDAPTERGRKHLFELILAKEQGYEALLLFVVQMKGTKGFLPNDENDPAFGKALRQAKDKGVTVKVLECTVLPDELKITAELPLLF